MTLCGLRVPEELEGVMEYVRSEAEKISDKTNCMAYNIERGIIPDAEAGYTPTSEDRG
jgi:hypothetical protein